MTNQEIPDSSESSESSSEDDEVTFKPNSKGNKKPKVLLQKCEQAYEQSKNIKDYNKLYHLRCKNDFRQKQNYNKNGRYETVY